MTTTDTLDIELVRKPEGIVVNLTGSASMELCDRLNQALEEACQGGPRLVVVDMRRLVFICSLGLGALVVAYVRLRKNNGRLVLTGPPESIRDMLSTTKLAELLPVFESTAVALAT